MQPMDQNTEGPESGGYEVGYGKPPKAHQFKKGCKSPNPKGRPKGAKGIKALVCEAAEAPTEYVIKGQKKKASRIEVALQHLALKAAKGDIKAIDKLTHLYSQHGPPSPVDESMLDTDSDAATIEQFLELAKKYRKDPA